MFIYENVKNKDLKTLLLIGNRWLLFEFLKLQIK